jgi:hypothetical protein
VAAFSEDRSVGHLAEWEKAMRHLTQCSILSLLCLFGTQQGQAQPAVCGGDHVCITEAPAAVPTKPEQSPAVAKVANLAGLEQCTRVAVDVTASSSEERLLACSAAGEALELLGRCKIFARKRVSLHILSEVHHPHNGQIFGVFDPFRQRAVVTRLSNIPAMVEATPYALLPHADFYRSLIVHEVVHVVMHQNLIRPTTTHSAHEYPAYALQIESLPADVRDQFLQSFDQQAVKSTALFSDPVLMFDPYFFAASAYHHFKASSNGCANLAALLNGEVDFIASANM